MSADQVYVVLYCDYEGSHLLWAGIGKDAAVQAVKDARAGIIESERVHKDILGEYPNERDYSTVTEAEWNELERRQGEFAGYHDPARVCILHESGPFHWDCCCRELGLETSEPVGGDIVG